MLGCESNFKENAELVVTIALGKRYMSDIVFLLLLSLPFVKIFLLPFLKSWFTCYIFIVLLKIMCFTKYVEYIHFYSQIYADIFTQRDEEEKEWMCVTKAKRISFPALWNGNSSNILSWGLKKLSSSSY